MTDSKADSKSESKVDESLYSRQLYVFGHEAQRKMAETNVLIVTLKGLGAEIAKNVILAGVKSVGLLDLHNTEIADLGSNFYLTEKDVGKPRAEASIDQFVGLNKYVNVHLVKEQLSEKLIQNYNVVVLTDAPLSEQTAVNAYCHKHGVKFIAGNLYGLFASTFVDLGESHTVTDLDGEQLKRGLVVSVSQDKAGVVIVHEDQRHNLETGDIVTFEAVQGMTELNGATHKVKVLTPFSFSIGDTTAFGKFTGTQGYFQQQKTVKDFKFERLEQQIAKPSFVSDYGASASLHFLAQALSEFQHEHKRLPRPDSKEDAHATVELAKKAAAKREQKLDVDEKVLSRLARTAGASLNPMAAVFGGVIGQEVLKACSGKFTPIAQFFYFDGSTALPDTEHELKEYAPANSRYDHQIAVFGRGFQQQLAQLRFFLVGAGAIGCEMLKNWALMGVATGDKGLIYLTDMDSIEKSNLNRQFLFRPADVGQLKSKSAAKAIQRMNDKVKVDAQAIRVDKSTESHYDDAFWEALDGVTTALDNVAARKYVDERCVYFQKPLVDSGTLGTKGNTQVVVPFLTESYGSSNDPPEASIPVCTVKSFPNQIEHTIQWAREVFEGAFKGPASEVNNYVTNADFFNEIKKSPNEYLSTLATLKENLGEKRPKSWADCVAWARLSFQENFSNAIKQLLLAHPADKVIEGVPFWSGLKRAPTPAEFDPKDELHMDYIVAAASLRAFNFGIKPETDSKSILDALAATVVPEFVPDRSVKIAASDAELKEMKKSEEEGGGMGMDEVEAKAKQLRDAIPPVSSLGAGFKCHPAEFEKDDDTNHHIAFITACSNLRARCYKIAEASRHQTKFIAGKIIPAIATTTALVTGLVCLEWLKILHKKRLEAYRNSYVNLAINLFAQSEPFPPASKKIAQADGKEFKFSMWDRIEPPTADPTLQEFIDWFQNLYGLEIESISAFGCTLFASWSRKKNAGNKFSKLVQDIAKVELSAKNKYVDVVVLATKPDAENDEPVEIPAVRLRLH